MTKWIYDLLTFALDTVNEHNADEHAGHVSYAARRSNSPDWVMVDVRKYTGLHIASQWWIGSTLRTCTSYRNKVASR